MRLLAGALAALATVMLQGPASAESTLDQVRKRGELVCGVDGSLPGFSLYNAVKEWEGLDVDLCRAVAAAVLGDARKVRFVPEDWTYNVISQVGNYGDIYERNVGMASPLKFSRGVNALWTKGGQMYPLLLR
jgi:general L-amino acid transport system substrate-binding protein